jgi:hypothetical protein
LFNPIWSLVAASVIAVIGGIVVYRQVVAHLSESSSEEDFQARRQRAYSSFVIRFLLVELVSMSILLYGMYHIVVLRTVEFADVTLPLAVVLLTILFAFLSLYFTTSQITKDPQASEDVKRFMSSMMITGFGLISGPPVASLILLFGVMNQWF